MDDTRCSSVWFRDGFSLYGFSFSPDKYCRLAVYCYKTNEKFVINQRTIYNTWINATFATLALLNWRLHTLQSFTATKRPHAQKYRRTGPALAPLCLYRNRKYTRTEQFLWFYVSFLFFPVAVVQEEGK